MEKVIIEVAKNDPEAQIMRFSEYLKMMRKKRDMSQRELALKANVSNAEISRIEAGQRKTPSTTVLKSLAQALDVPEVDMLKAAGAMSDQEEAPISPEILRLVKELHLDSMDETQLSRLRSYADFLVSTP